MHRLASVRPMRQGQYPPVRCKPSRTAFTISASGFSVIVGFIKTPPSLFGLFYQKTRAVYVTGLRKQALQLFPVPDFDLPALQGYNALL